MKFIFLDEIYPHAWATLPNHSYEAWFDQCFGTSNFWDIALQAAGHESDTLIHNMEPDALGIVANLQPDVVCVQNIGLWPAHLLRARGIKSKLVAFCSYRAANENMEGWDVLFTSFPWLVQKMKEFGRQRCEYLPLAFGRSVLARVENPRKKDIPLSFVGGLGYPIWKKGTDDLATVARQFPEFKWWGYQVGRLPDELMKSYQGPAWGKQYYQILMRSKITINRHGEIAKGFGNNMRQYDAVGCGSLLLTDHLGEIAPENSAFYYPSWSNNAVGVLQELSDDEVTQFGAKGQSYILENHCYENRVPKFLDVIESL